MARAAVFRETSTARPLPSTPVPNNDKYLSHLGGVTCHPGTTQREKVSDSRDVIQNWLQLRYLYLRIPALHLYCVTLMGHIYAERPSINVLPSLRLQGIF